MKRKQGSNELKNWRKSTIWGLSSILVLSAFLTGYGNTDREVIKDLLIKRSGIIQMVWYSSVTPSQGETMLKHVETHPLLGEDVSWLRSAEEGMGFAYVLDLDVLNVKQTSFSSRGTCYVAEILWESLFFATDSLPIAPVRRTINGSECHKKTLKCVF